MIVKTKLLGSTTLPQKIKENPGCYSFVHILTDLKQSILQENIPQESHKKLKNWFKPKLKSRGHAFQIFTNFHNEELKMS